ncbi:Serine/threonine-protein kinase Sgk1 [Colletotrichum orbiculare MAFF 240422]|uniref:Serine/threonine-protein kinase Sgk1 n=1 Tax=Colletotrichum orbiculare (strain 104-T / ATCC 96160 / CBS 514.97 / LARS 414 / MAFF 240422) TaxID=1213857 RepID=N4V6L0_COLOR|nr:Serine/threonine-protein kinase Sgk1 [Colletotrichum orbiculare MAFF 240422]
MASTSLFKRLNKSLESNIVTGKCFLPNDAIRSIVTGETIRDELPRSWLDLFFADNLPNLVAREAPKLFAILALIGETSTIRRLISDGLTDLDLPFTLVESASNGSVIISARNKEVLSLTEWRNDAKVGAFIEKQWLVLAPTLELTAEFGKVDERFPLPFLGGDFVRGTDENPVYRCELHSAHELSATEQDHKRHTTIAVKVLKKAVVFEKERRNLEKIRSIENPHLIQHLLCIERGDSNYILFPWANGGNLKDLWSQQTCSPALILWSLEQMLGLSQALHELHLVNCRHGDLKPANILHFKAGGLGTLVIADVGESKIHHQVTDLRKGITITTATTPAYEPPEAILEKHAPRRRRYDVWSMACIYLEHITWMLFGHDAILGFNAARDEPGEKFYKLTSENGMLKASVHPSVLAAIEVLRNDARCSGVTALGDVIDLIREHMLCVRVEERVPADVLYEKLKAIVDHARNSSSYMMNSVELNLETPQIFQWSGNDTLHGQTSTSRTEVAI